MAFCNDQCPCGRDCSRQDAHGGKCACEHHRGPFTSEELGQKRGVAGSLLVSGALDKVLDLGTGPKSGVAGTIERILAAPGLADTLGVDSFYTDKKGDVSGKLSHADGANMTEEDFLAAYKAKDYPKPSVAVDLAIFTITDSDLKVLLIRRGGHPCRGKLALPGGFVDVGDGVREQGESLDEAAHRELAEETGLPRGSCFLEQLFTFGDPYRDPRLRVISVAYYALVRPTLAPFVKAGDDAADAGWFSVSTLDTSELAFDHAKVLATAVARIRGKIDYAPIAFDLVPETFTVSDLHAVYQAVKGQTYNPKAFHRRFQRMAEDGTIIEAEGRRQPGPGGGPPAKVYKFCR